MKVIMQAMSDYGRRASDALKRGITLGVNTDTSQLTDSQRAVHEKAVGKMQIKLAMISSQWKTRCRR